MGKTCRQRSREDERNLARPLACKEHTPPAQTRLVLCLMLSVAVLAGVIHWPALSAQALSLDDAAFLAENKLVQNPSWASVQRFFGEVLEPSTVGGYYLPLSMTSLMLDYAAGGRADDLVPFHRTSLTLHACNAGLIVLLLFLLFGQPWVATCVGLLFAAHPLTVEPTVWVGERKTLLAGFLALCALVCYIRFVKKRRWSLYIAALFCYALSLLSKPTATTLPILLILLDIWPLAVLSFRKFLQKVPFFIVGGLSGIITLISHSRTASLELPQSLEPWRAPLIICRNTIFYLYKIVWPVDLSSAYYVPEPLSLAHPMVLAGVVGMAILVAALLISLRWTRAVLVGGLFFFVAILPTLGAIRYSWVSASDKYVYFPSLGLLLILTYGLARFWSASHTRPLGRARRVVLIAAVAGLTGLESVRTRSYLRCWRDTETLRAHMVDMAPGSPRSLTMLGNVLLEDGQVEEAVAQYVHAVQVDPRYSSAHSILAMVLYKRGEVGRALEHWNAALRAAPRFANAHANLAVALAELGRIDEAIEHFESALSFKPKYPFAHNNYAMTLFKLGRLDDAAAHCRDALRQRPGYGNAHLNLGIILNAQGRTNEAYGEFRAALLNGADVAKTRRGLGDASAKLGRLDEAVEHYEVAVQWRQRDPTLHNNLAFVLIRQGKLEAAAAYITKALELAPDFTGARLNLAYIREQQGSYDAAIEEYRRILRANPSHRLARERLEAAMKERQVRRSTPEVGEGP